MNDAALAREAAIRARVKAALAAHRKKRRWNPRSMAEALHVSPKYYEAYEGDPDRSVPVSVIARFCRYTNRNIDRLLFSPQARRHCLRRKPG